MLCTPTTKVAPRSPCVFMQVLMISSPATWAPGTSITTATADCCTTIAENCPPSSPTEAFSSGGASTTSPATWWPGVASRGTVTVKGTVTLSAPSSLKSASENDSHCRVPRL